MMMKLPYSDFRWMSESELNAFNVESFNCAGDYGAVLEVITSLNILKPLIFIYYTAMKIV